MLLDTKKFIVIGDNTALDFINTQIVDDGQPKDLLENFNDLLAWQVAAGLLDESAAETLSKKWGRLQEAQKLFKEAREFRKTLRETVESLSKKKLIKESAVNRINEILNQRFGHHELIKTKKGFEKRFRAEFDEPRQLLVPIAESAADLIALTDWKNIRKCENSECILYFHDTTKNHRRRWCSMGACGNRAKAAAFYKRKKNRRP
jgi:predicted RNA-binding Zn ribbon-like protein